VCVCVCVCVQLRCKRPVIAGVQTEEAREAM